ncbi:MAG: peptidylprolyl isomerase [Lentisphaeria bacterium]
MKKGFVALVGMMLLSAGMLSGDTIKLRNGQEYEGKVVVRGDVYTVIQGDAVFQFQKKEVAEMNGEKLVREENPVIRIATSKGDMLVELYEDEAPNTVANIITLAESGFYKGMAFHRIINGFMAQGGCPNSKRGATGQPGTGGPGYRFADEFAPNLKHTGRGILSMANAGPGTNGSQFFICFGPTPHLDGRHSVFGKVTSGMEVLDKLEAVGTQSGQPREEIRFNIEVVSKRNHVYTVKKL